MKRVTKLTEGDLTRIVRRVIKEDNEEDKMDGMRISITLDDVFKEVRESLYDLGDYDDATMGKKAMTLAKDIMGDFQDDLSTVLADYISLNYEDYLYEVLGDEGEDF
jgi:hypothetical protein